MHTFPTILASHLRLKAEVIQFSVSDLDLPGFERPASLPLPDARYLEIHAACCKVAHMSGAAEYLDAIIRDMETMSFLASDGGSAEVLIHAMSRLVEPG